MNAHVAPHRGTVALIGLVPPDLDGVRNAVVLAGARVCSNPGQASLILASASAPVPEGTPCVRVGQGGQVRLPVDTALLVSLIAEASSRTRRSGAVWVVAGIAGGVGVTGIVRLLARERGSRRSVRGGVRRGERGARRARSGEAVVVDASGSVPGVALAADHDVPGVRWADLDASEDSYLPSLREHLPVVGGVRALVGDSRGGAAADDPRVVAACRSLDAPLIVDAGRCVNAGGPEHLISSLAGGPSVVFQVAEALTEADRTRLQALGELNIKPDRTATLNTLRTDEALQMLSRIGGCHSLSIHHPTLGDAYRAATGNDLISTSDTTGD